MRTMDGSQATRVDVDHLPAIRRTAPERLSTAWAYLLGLGWPAVYALCLVLEPRPDGRNAEQLGAVAGVLAELGGLAVFAALVATGVTAARRSRRATAWGLAAGGVLAAMVVACPASGHHALGGWWLAQMALVGGMLAVTVRSQIRA